MNAACAASSLAANICGSTVRRSSQGPAHRVPASPTRSSAAVGALRGGDIAKAWAAVLEADAGAAFAMGVRWTILNSDFAGVLPANQHRVEPTCRYFSDFPRYSLAASLCVRHARLGAAIAGADVSARSTTSARTVRIATPPTLTTIGRSNSGNLRICAGSASGTGPRLWLTPWGVESSGPLPEYHRLTVCLHLELDGKNDFAACKCAGGGSWQALSSGPCACEHIPGGKFSDAAAMTRFLVCG